MAGDNTFYVDIDAVTKNFSSKIREALGILDGFDKGANSRLKSIQNIFSPKNLIGFGLAAVGIRETVKAVMDLTKYTARLEDQYAAALIPLQNITKETGDYGQSLRLIDQLANTTGQEFLALSTAYKNVYASAKQAGYATSDINNIFTSVSRSASAMKLGNEQVARTFKAIEQMMNKGKIRAEELNQQLADHIPGAFAIMAKAAQDAGISTSGTTEELSKLLEKGELLSKDILPHFAKRMEEAFGKDANRNVETLTGSANRMRNEFQQLMIALDDNKSMRFWASFNNGIADALRGVRSLVNSNEWGLLAGLLLGNSNAQVKAGGKIQLSEISNMMLTNFSMMDTPTQLDAVRKKMEQLREAKRLMNIEPLTPFGGLEENTKYVSNLTSELNEMVRMLTKSGDTSTNLSTSLGEVSKEANRLQKEIQKLSVEAITTDTIDNQAKRIKKAFAVEEKEWEGLLKQKKISSASFNEWLKLRETVLQNDLLEIRQKFWSQVKSLDILKASETEQGRKKAMVLGMADIFGIDLEGGGKDIMKEGEEAFSESIANFSKASNEAYKEALLGGKTSKSIEATFRLFGNNTERVIKETSAQMISALESTFGFFGDTISMAFTRAFNKDFKFKENFKGLLGDFLQAFGGVIMKMGEAMLAAAIIKTNFENALASLGKAAIPIAIAMIGLGAAMRAGGFSINMPKAEVPKASNSGYGSPFSNGINVNVSGALVADGTQLKAVLNNTDNFYG